MKNNIFLVFLLLLSGLLGGYFLYEKQIKNETGLSCYSQASFIYPLINNKDRVELGMLFLFEENTGLVSYSGTITSEGANYNVKRYAEVDYIVHDGTSYFIRTKALYPDVSDNVPEALSKKYFYGYLDRVNGWVNFRIIKDSASTYTFYTNSIPNFVCKKR